MLNTFYDKYIFTNNLNYVNHNFSLRGIPFIIAPTELLIGLQDVDNDEFARAIYAAAKEGIAKNLMHQIETFEFGLHGEKLLNFMLKYFVASGWGSIECVNLDIAGKKAIVKLTNNPLGAKLHKKINKPVDHLLRGILAGIFSRVFNETVDCVETHCMAQGEFDCEFIIKRQPEFDIANKEVRRQLQLGI